MPLVDRFLAPLAAAGSSPLKRPQPKGKLLDVERMFHEVAPRHPSYPLEWWGHPLAPQGASEGA